MLSQPRTGRCAEHRHCCILVLLLIGSAPLSLPISARSAPATAVQPAIVEVEGKVDISRGNSGVWGPASTNQLVQAGDWVRTGERSRAVVRLSELSTLRLGEQTIIQVPSLARKNAGFNFLKGILYYFHRDKPGVFPVQTPTAYAVILGTEFALSVADNGAARLDLIDGRVEMTNGFGAVALVSGEAASAAAGQPPARTAAIQAVNIVQWCLYYPAVLNLDELPLAVAERQTLAPSLAAYQQGDLLAALSEYPAGRQPASDAEKIYLAGLLLAIGQVDRVEPLLRTVGADARLTELADAFRTVIAAVNHGRLRAS